MYAIASNSKLFLALSVGLIMANDSLQEARGEKIDWDTKVKKLIPEWGLMDEDMDRGVNIQDMLSHRTGMPRHDMSGMVRAGGVPEMVGNFLPLSRYRLTRFRSLLCDTSALQQNSGRPSNTTTLCTKHCRISPPSSSIKRTSHMSMIISSLPWA